MIVALVLLSMAQPVALERWEFKVVQKGKESSLVDVYYKGKLVADDVPFADIVLAQMTRGAAKLNDVRYTPEGIDKAIKDDRDVSCFVWVMGDAVRRGFKVNLPPGDLVSRRISKAAEVLGRRDK